MSWTRCSSPTVLGCTPLRSLETGPVTASPAASKRSGQLAHLCELDAAPWICRCCPERRRFLAGVGRGLTGRALARRELNAATDLLACWPTAVDVLDEVVCCSIRASLDGSRRRRPGWRTSRRAAEKSARTGRRCSMTCWPSRWTRPSPRAGRGAAARGATVGMERMRSARPPAKTAAARSRAAGDVDAWMSYLRQFARPCGGGSVCRGTRHHGACPGGRDTGGGDATGTRKVPAGAPPPSCRPAGRATCRRPPSAMMHHRLPALFGSCACAGPARRLRSGGVYMPSSRRYADPAAFLLTPAQWEPRRAEYCQLVGKFEVRPVRWPPPRQNCTPLWPNSTLSSPPVTGRACGSATTAS